MDRKDFETSTARAKRAQTNPRVVVNVTKDFSWRTYNEDGSLRWHWLPFIIGDIGPVWNPAGGPALVGFHKRTYWLCMGWSRIETVEVDPRDTIQNGGNGDGRA